MKKIVFWPIYAVIPLMLAISIAGASHYPYDFNGIGLSASASPYYFETGYPTTITFQAQWLPNVTNNYCTINCPWVANASARIEISKGSSVLAQFMGLTTDNNGIFTATFTAQSKGMYSVNGTVVSGQAYAWELFSLQGR
jgi:hypothetical protein